MARLVTQLLGLPLIVVGVGQVADELAPRPPVAFAEGVQRIQFAKVMPCTVAKRGLVKTGRCFSRARCSKIGSAARCDIGVMGKFIAALTDISR